MIRCEGLSVRSAALPSGIDRLFYIIRFFAPAVPSEAAWLDRTAENRGRRRPPKTQFCSYNVPVRMSSFFVAASFGAQHPAQHVGLEHEVLVEGAGDVQGQQDEDQQHAGAMHRGHRPDAAEPGKRAGCRHQENDGIEGEMDGPGGEAQGRVLFLGRRRAPRLRRRTTRSRASRKTAMPQATWRSDSRSSVSVAAAPPCAARYAASMPPCSTTCPTIRDRNDPVQGDLGCGVTRSGNRQGKASLWGLWLR